LYLTALLKKAASKTYLQRTSVKEKKPVKPYVVWGMATDLNWS